MNCSTPGHEARLARGVPDRMRLDAGDRQEARQQRRIAGDEAERGDGDFFRAEGFSVLIAMMPFCLDGTESVDACRAAIRTFGAVANESRFVGHSRTLKARERLKELPFRQ